MSKIIKKINSKFLVFINSDHLFLEDSEIIAFAEGEGDGENITLR